MTSVREEYLRLVNIAVERKICNGICSIITQMYIDDYLSHTEYLLTLDCIIEITKDLGFYSGSTLFPIKGMDVNECHVDAYTVSARHKSLWDKNTEYGKARIAIALALAEKL